MQLQLGPQELEHFGHVFLQVLGSWLAFGAAIGPIVPREDIDALIEEHLEVVGVTQVDHLLVEHGV